MRKKVLSFLIGISMFVISCGDVGGGADVGSTVIISTSSIEPSSLVITVQDTNGDNICDFNDTWTANVNNISVSFTSEAISENINASPVTCIKTTIDFEGVNLQSIDLALPITIQPNETKSYNIDVAPIVSYLKNNISSTNCFNQSVLLVGYLNFKFNEIYYDKSLEIKDKPINIIITNQTSETGGQI